jgi:rhodanese-related sulfurtransferase
METSFDQVLMAMDLEFIGQARHKITPAALFETDRFLLLDIRTDPEQQTLPLGFVHHGEVRHLPLNQLPRDYHHLPVDRVIGIFCPHGVRAAMAYAYLRSKGFNSVYVLDGGYAALAEEARPGAVLKRCAQRATQGENPL